MEKTKRKPMSDKSKKSLKITGIVLAVILVLIIIALTVIVPLVMRELILSRDAYFKIINPSLAKKNNATNPYMNAEMQKWLVDNSVDRTITSDDNLKLHAYDLRQPNETHNYVLVQHGYMRSGKYMAIIADKFYKLGYNVFLPDFRAHGKSEGKYVGFGLHEKDDTLRWIESIVKSDNQAKIVLYGESMGAATIMLTASDKNLQDNVKVAIEDCGYTNALEQYKWKAHDVHIPAWPVLPLMSDYSKQYLGYKVGDVSPIDALKNCKVPMLFMHGTADTLVPFYMMNELYNACPTQKDKFIAEGKKHVRSYQKEGYWEKVEEFINLYINK